MVDATGTAWQHAERAARDAYGRLIALLSCRGAELADAEDALSSALLAALEHWPRDGVPDAPSAWLLTVARRQLYQGWRHRQVTLAPAVRAVLEDDAAVTEDRAIPDGRLRLMLVCAHPLIPVKVRAPLMLQIVLGLDACRIADAFLVSPNAMAQRLVRAKARIREAGLRFEEAEASELPERLAAVLDAIYGAYSIGSNVAAVHPPGQVPVMASALTEEAVFLARLVARLLPAEAEAKGLLALMLYCEARRPARFDQRGQFVALTQQDCAQWDRPLIGEAEACLREALALRQSGSYQLEAAIQSAHCQRAYGGDTPWPAIVELYAALIAEAPRIGARIGHAVATAEAEGALAGLALLAMLPAGDVRNHQPYWVALAYLERKANHLQAADAALERALGLTADARVRAHLRATAVQLGDARP